MLSQIDFAVSGWKKNYREHAMIFKLRLEPGRTTRILSYLIAAETDGHGPPVVHEASIPEQAIP